MVADFQGAWPATFTVRGLGLLGTMTAVVLSGILCLAVIRRGHWSLNWGWDTDMHGSFTSPHFQELTR